MTSVKGNTAFGCNLITSDAHHVTHVQGQDLIFLLSVAEWSIRLVDIALITGCCTLDIQMVSN